MSAELAAIAARIEAAAGDGAAQHGLVDEALRAWSGEPEALDRVATALKNVAAFELAAQLYERGLERDPEAAPLHLELGKVRRDQGQTQLALVSLERACALAPTDAYAFASLGIVQEALGELESARASYSQATRLEPASGMHHLCLGKVLGKLGQEAASQAEFDQARGLMESETDYNKACLEALSGNPDRALEHLERFLAERPFGKSWAAQDTDLESLHGFDAFQRLIS